MPEKCLTKSKIKLPHSHPIGLIKNISFLKDGLPLAIKIFTNIIIILLTAAVIQSCKQAEDSKLDFSFKKAKVTFTVDMASQRILGFFEPEEGDKVVFEYSVNDTLNKAVILKKYGTDIYKTVLNFSIDSSNDSKPIEYRYKIITNRKAMLPNNGYEKAIRLVNINKKEMNLPTAYFNNIQKAVRFIIDTKKWKEQKKFNPLEDNISIKLFFNGKNFMEPLTKVNKDIYEAAVEIPLNVKNIKWQVVKNRRMQLAKLDNADIKNYGGVIRL